MDGFVSWLHSLRLLRECNPSYGVLTLSPVGLSPTEHASLRWSHYGPKTRSCGEQTPRAQFRFDFLNGFRQCYSRCYAVKTSNRRVDLTPSTLSTNLLHFQQGGRFGPYGMIAICGIENELAVFADGERSTVVHHGGRHHSDSRVGENVVVPRGKSVGKK